MSYGLALARDALADLGRLPAWLQEDVLDEFEGVAHDPSILPDAPDGAEVTYRFSRHDGRSAHHVTVTHVRADRSASLTVLGIAHRQVS